MSKLDDLLKQQAELQKKIDEAKAEEAEVLKEASVKAFAVFKVAVEKRAFATGEEINDIILELANISLGKSSKVIKIKSERRSSDEVKAEKAELTKQILAFLKKQGKPVSAKVIREGIGAGDGKKLIIGGVLAALRKEKQVKMDGEKASATWSLLK